LPLVLSALLKSLGDLQDFLAYHFVYGSIGQDATFPRHALYSWVREVMGGGAFPTPWRASHLQEKAPPQQWSF
jgi:hypothetical protein